EDRYATALELAADVEHWLADEPVAAYREPWTGRARRWARRHRAAVAAVAAAVAALVVLGGVGAWGLGQPAAERSAEAAKHEADRRTEVERARLAVAAALAQAKRLQGQALWAEAEEALDKVTALAGAAGLRQRLEHARTNLRLVKKLDDIR